MGHAGQAISAAVNQAGRLQPVQPPAPGAPWCRLLPSKIDCAGKADTRVPAAGHTSGFRVSFSSARRSSPGRRWHMRERLQGADRACGELQGWGRGSRWRAGRQKPRSVQGIPRAGSTQKRARRASQRACTGEESACRLVVSSSPPQESETIFVCLTCRPRSSAPASSAAPPAQAGCSPGPATGRRQPGYTPLSASSVQCRSVHSDWQGKGACKWPSRPAVPPCPCKKGSGEGGGGLLPTWRMKSRERLTMSPHILRASSHRP